MTQYERRMLVVMLGMLAAITPLSIDMYLPSLPAIQEGLNATAADVQLTISVFLIGLSLGQLIYGPLSDRYGRKPILLGGIFIFAVTSLMCALAASIESLITFRFFHAIGGGSGMVLGRAIARDFFPANETARLMSLMAIIMMMGPMISPIVGGYMLVLVGWRSIFWMLAALGVVYFFIVVVAIKESHPHENREQLNLVSTFRAYGEVLRNRRAFGYIACLALGSGSMFAYITNAPFVFIELFGIRPDNFGYLHGAIVAGLITCAIINSKLVMHYGLDRMIIYGNLVRLFGTLLLLFVGYFKIGGLMGLMLALILCISPNALITPNASAGMLHLFPRITGTASAVLGAAMFALGSVSGSIVGFLHDGTVMPMVITMAMFSFASIGSYWWLVSLPGRAELVENDP